MPDTKNVIVHGDSRDYIDKISTPINCVVTDPPYGMNFASNMGRLPTTRALTGTPIQGDATTDEAIKTFLSIMEKIVPKLADQADLYVFTAWHVLEDWIPAVKSLDGLVLKQMLVWDKGNPGMGDLECNWGCGHEIILYLKKGRRPIPKRRSGILHVEVVPPGQIIHQNEKPTQLLRMLIEMSTDPGDLVVDPYSGSGSTSLAAQQCGRNSLAFEIDERFIGPSRDRLKAGSLF